MANLPTDHSLKPGLLPSLGGTQATDYILEQRVLKRYRWLLREGLAGPTALDELLHTCFPEYFQGKQQELCQVYWQADERVEHDIPEVIIRLPRAELERIAALLDVGDLVGCIRLVWYELRPVLCKMDPPQALLDDSKIYQAAGMGHLARQLVKKRSVLPLAVAEGACIEATPPTDTESPILEHSRQTPSSTPTPTLPPARPQLRPRKAIRCESVQQHVRRAQERKRLKRKRRR